MKEPHSLLSLGIPSSPLCSLASRTKITSTCWSATQIYICLECANHSKLDYCPGGEVFTYLRRAHCFEEPIARFYAAEMVLCFEFLHDKKGIAYRDLKPENILIDGEGHLKLVDFGFAKAISTRMLVRHLVLRLCADYFSRRDLYPVRNPRISRPRGNP